MRNSASQFKILLHYVPDRLHILIVGLYVSSHQPITVHGWNKALSQSTAHNMSHK